MANGEALSYRKRRVILFSVIVSFILLLTAFFMIHTASAVDESGDGHRFGGTIIITNDDYEALCKEMGEEYKYLENITTIFTTEGPTEENGGTPSLMWSLLEAGNSPVRTAKNITTIIGLALVFIYAGTQLFQMFQREAESTETIIRILAMAVIGGLAVIFAYDILKGVETFGNLVWKNIRDEAYRAVDTKITYTVLTGEEVKVGEALTLASIFSRIGDFFKNLWTAIRSVFGSGLSYIVGRTALTFTFYMIVVSAYGLLFEMVIRKVFTPIAMADLTINGPRSSSIRYIRGYFGMYLRIAATVLIVALGLYMQMWSERFANGELAQQMNRTLGSFGVCICSRAAMKALMNSSGEIIREVVSGRGESR